MTDGPMRLVAVSNRLPITTRRDDGEWEIRPGAGGLVTALAPVLRNRGGLWIGWSGTTEEVDLETLMGPASEEAGYSLRPVVLTEEEVAGFYHGFANEIIWPLFHELQTRCIFTPEYWHSYLQVNRKFAEVVARNSTERDYIWVHDYHLMHLGHALQSIGVTRKTGFFLHIPFPPVDMFLKLPWRAEILRALLDYDLVGFQTMRDRRNFVQCCQQLCPEARTKGRGPAITVSFGQRQVRVGAFPISIDFKAFAQRTASKEVEERAWYLHEKFPERQIILGVDRLDYTKGIPEGLEAFRKALIRFPDMHGNVTMVQIVVPSREEVPEYQGLKAQIERTVGEIDGQFTRPGWVPIHYLYRSLNPEELTAYYQAAEIALITPLRDGMNLVAKEYCACNIEENGVLILSEFAGAAAQLHRGALLVNPYDIEGLSEMIHRAFVMDEAEKHTRMRRLRESIRRRDIFWWVDTFLQAAFAKHLGDFPAVDEYMPEIVLAENARGT